MKCRFAHIADVHANDANYPEIEQCLHNIYKTCKIEGIDFTIIAGDLWDHKLWTHSPSFRGVVDWVMLMNTLGPVFMIYGTPTHDPPGSYSIFERMNDQDLLTIAKEPCTTFAYKDGQPIAHISLLPHIDIPPHKSLDQTMQVRQLAMQKSIDTLYEASCEYPHLPSIFVGHLAVIGCVIPQGTDGYEVHPDALSRFNYSALGHVHPKNQNLVDNVQYAGSVWHTETGDVSEKGFYIVDLGTEPGQLRKTFYNAGSHAVVKLEAHFTESGIEIPTYETVHNTKVRITVYIPSKFRNAFNAKELEENIIQAGAVSCIVVPRVLQEEIEIIDFGYTRDVRNSSWGDKFRAYCDAVDLNITDNIMDKVNQLISEVVKENDDKVREDI